MYLYNSATRKKEEFVTLPFGQICSVFPYLNQEVRLWRAQK